MGVANVPLGTPVRNLEFKSALVLLNAGARLCDCVAGEVWAVAFLEGPSSDELWRQLEYAARETQIKTGAKQRLDVDSLRFHYRQRSELRRQPNRCRNCHGTGTIDFLGMSRKCGCPAGGTP
jgi:hypothetical protein